MTVNRVLMSFAPSGPNFKGLSADAALVASFWAKLTARTRLVDRIISQRPAQARKETRNFVEMLKRQPPVSGLRDAVSRRP